MLNNNELSTRESAIAAADAAVKKFIDSPDTKINLDRNFGFGVRAVDVVQKGRRLREDPPSRSGFRNAGDKWSVIHETQWPNIFLQTTYFKSPGDEHNVQIGDNFLFKKTR